MKKQNFDSKSLLVFESLPITIDRARQPTSNTHATPRSPPSCCALLPFPIVHSSASIENIRHVSDRKHPDRRPAAIHQAIHQRQSPSSRLLGPLSHPGTRPRCPSHCRRRPNVARWFWLRVSFLLDQSHPILRRRFVAQFARWGGWTAAIEPTRCGAVKIGKRTTNRTTPNNGCIKLPNPPPREVT